jgi:hypothetical protein
MSQYLIPLDNAPNQTWQVTVFINGVSVTFGVNLNFNEVAGLWEMSIFDASGTLLLSSLPLVTGLNLLAQFGYLNIGSIWIVDRGGVGSTDYPNASNLGSSFAMVWGDTAAYVP